MECGSKKNDTVCISNKLESKNVGSMASSLVRGDEILPVVRSKINER